MLRMYQNCSDAGDGSWFPHRLHLKAIAGWSAFPDRPVSQSLGFWLLALVVLSPADSDHTALFDVPSTAFRPQSTGVMEAPRVKLRQTFFSLSSGLFVSLHDSAPAPFRPLLSGFCRDGIDRLFESLGERPDWRQQRNPRHDRD